MSMMNAFCQVAVVEGIPKRSESILEGHYRNILENSGPKMMLERLKTLKQHALDQLMDPSAKLTQSDKQTIRTSTAGNVKGPEKILYDIFPNPEKRVAVIGALITSLEIDELIIDDVEKAHDNITRPAAPEPGKQPALPRALLERINNSLKTNLANMGPFGPSNLTASAIPYGPAKVNIRSSKEAVIDYVENKGNLPMPKASIAHLGVIAETQRLSCPLFIHDYLCSQAERLMNDGIELEVGQAHWLADRRPYDSWFNQIHIDENDIEDVGRNDYEDYNEFSYIGSLSFLKQPGLKLRTVANPNRYVNYALESFGRAIADNLYTDSHIHVTNQERGIRWAQAMLRTGKELSSFDLSAATDSLSAEAFWDAQDLNGLDYLADAVDAFNDASRSPWYSSYLDGPVTWKQGQPLGVAGSFQTLTLQNWAAAYTAESRFFRDNPELKKFPMFAVVGDDMILDSRIAEGYVSNIRNMGGVINTEKALVSSKYGEFLSRIITKDKVIPLKRKFQGFDVDRALSQVANAPYKRVQSIYSSNKGLTRLSNDQLNSLELLSSYGSPQLSAIPLVKGGQKRHSIGSRRVAATVARISAQLRGGLPDTFQVTDQTLLMAIDENLDLFSESPAHSFFFDEDGDVRVPTRNSASYAVSDTVYNHKSGSYEPRKHSDRGEIRRLQTLLSGYENFLNEESTSFDIVEALRRLEYAETSAEKAQAKANIAAIIELESATRPSNDSSEPLVLASAVAKTSDELLLEENDLVLDSTVSADFVAGLKDLEQEVQRSKDVEFLL